MMRSKPCADLGEECTRQREQVHGTQHKRTFEEQRAHVEGVLCG